MNPSTTTEWQAAQRYEQQYWDREFNMSMEVQKQRLYARHMGIRSADLCGKSILDIGGGPASFLLQCRNFRRATVVDPLPAMDATRQRYAQDGINLVQETAESFTCLERYDEVWIYNVLQHVIDPQAVLKRAQACARVLRLWDWLDEPIKEGHIHVIPENIVAPFLDFYRIGVSDTGILQGTFITGVWLR